MSPEDIFRMIEEQGRRLHPIEEAVRTLQQKAAEEQAAKLRADALEFQTKAFDKAKSYINVLVVAGYGGTFAFWSYIRPQVTTHCAEASAIALFISLMSFLALQIFQIIWITWKTIKVRRFAKAPSTPVEAMRILQELGSSEWRATDSIFSVWCVSMAITTLAAFLAFAIILYNMFAILMDLPVWPS